MGTKCDAASNTCANSHILFFGDTMKFTKTHPVLLVLAASAVLCGTAMAGPGKLDKDGDRMLSRAEVAGRPMLEKNFDALDTNKDGKLSRDELKAGKALLMEQRRAELDVNKDGWIDRNEAAKSPRLAQHFDKLDTNKDGLLSRDEIKAASGMMGRGGKFAALDKNGDGMIDRAEAAGHPRLEKSFDAIDTNRDGRLSADEIKAAYGARRAK
jgi:Ca2+-binding EF-hand superfamily protein